MALCRLDKFLADAGYGTRSEVKTLLKQGKVTLDGTVCKDGSVKGDFEKSSVCVNGRDVAYEQFVYYLLNKPAGCVSATRDSLSDTVIELLKGVNTKGLFPVGRLDKDTEGLLLITNDGQLAHRLLSPKRHVEKCYRVVLDKPLSEGDCHEIEDCIDIGDEKPCLPAHITYDSEECVVYITITEGRYHQVKRMFAAKGYEVMHLKRISMGELKLPDSLQCGAFIKLESVPFN